MGSTSYIKQYLTQHSGVNSGDCKDKGQGKIFSFQYRITDWFVLEETFKNHLVHQPHHQQGHLSLDQVAQPGLEHLQAWAATTALDNLVRY